MAPWRLALSLVTLRDEVNATWPNRDKASDGTIGDPAHAATASDHNPNRDGAVCAFDITHDPVNGPDIAVLFNLLRTAPHPDCKYLIANRRIASRAQGGFQVRMYTGADPHVNHLHVSVGVGPDGRSVQPYDDTTPPWLASAPPPEEDMTAEEHQQLKALSDQVGQMYNWWRDPNGYTKSVYDQVQAALKAQPPAP